MPRKPTDDRWKQAEARYAEMERKLRPYVRSAKDNEAPTAGPWRRSTELQDDRLQGFRSGSEEEMIEALPER